MPRAAENEDPRAERLRRLLAILPLARRRSGVAVETLLATFGCPAETLFDDIRLLIMCGAPPYGPEDYIQATSRTAACTSTSPSASRGRCG